MTSKNELLRGAALVIVLAVAAGANAKPVHHLKKAAYGEAPAYASPASAEIAQLRAEVAELKALVQSQAQNQAQSQATLQARVAETDAKVTEVAANADAVQAQLDSVPQQVLTTVGELPKPKPSWAERTQISGRVYFNFSNIEQKSNGVRVTPSGAAFEIKRMYIGIDHQFNDVYSANLTTDFQYSSAIGATELYIKKAYLQAKYVPWMTIRVGSADLPWIPFAEDIYGYRHIEQTLTDRTKFGTSADWGAHAFGSLDPIGDKTGPVISYAVAAINGTGYKAPPGTGSAPRTDTLDLEGRVSVKWMDWTGAVGGYTGVLGKDSGPTSNAQLGPNAVRHDAKRFNALLAYTGGPYRLGVEYFNASNWTAVATIPTDRASGYSVFGSWQYDPQWSVFGRFDTVKPNKSTAPSKKESGYWNFGLDYRPVGIVDLALVYKRDKLENGTLSTGNGTIGGSRDGTYDEIGLFGQIRW